MRLKTLQPGKQQWNQRQRPFPEAATNTVTVSPPTPPHSAAAVSRHSKWNKTGHSRWDCSAPRSSTHAGSHDLTQPLSNPPSAAIWLAKHAGKAFVPVGGPATSKPKFEGERPGWVFKLGDQGLGYYVDTGRVRTVLLYREVVPG